MRESLLEDIKFNCDVSDAAYWGYFSVCGLLMRYRDLFRSEQGLDPWSPIPREEIAEWIGRKESAWACLESSRLRDLTVHGTACSPFDVDRINEAMLHNGVVYGAGYGMYLKPTFFLAAVRSVEVLEGHTVHTTERELVRDLFTVPAMVRERSIFLRLEPLQALLWDKFMEIRPDRGAALRTAYRSYGIEPGQRIDDVFARRLSDMALAYSRVLLRHELAESKEAVPQWKELLMHGGDRKTEHFLRAVQDLVADTSDAGPLCNISEKRDHAALSLFIGLLDGFRRLLFPEMREAYSQLQQHGSWESLEEARRAGRSRFLEIRRNILDRFTGQDHESFLRGVTEVIQEIDQAPLHAPGTPMTKNLATHRANENDGA